jgi:uroporphyrin-III C-methyltransferase
MEMEQNKPQALRIGISGSASAGKSTLAEALARLLKVPCLEEEMRTYLEHGGESLADLPRPSREKVILDLWNERRGREQTIPAFIADTSSLDLAACALHYECLSSSSYELLFRSAATHLRLYNAIFLLPWGVLPYEQDGIRPRDPYSELRFQLLIEGLLNQYVEPDRLHRLPGTVVRPEDRLSWALAKIAQLSPAPRPGHGTVYLVGAGPGDPKLLTMRAAELLQRADVIAYDQLISPELMAQVPHSVELLSVGRRDGLGATSYRLHPAVLERARRGKTVIRLKSGDPLLFGRGGEEAEELRKAGIPFEIVPGITAALGAASYAGIPLTFRGEASEVLLATGHEPERSTAEPNLLRVAGQRTTVLYMAARRLSANLKRLESEGYPVDTPAALILSATTPRQLVISGTVATLPALIPELDPEVPAILLVGTVIERRKCVSWFQLDDQLSAQIPSSIDPAGMDAFTDGSDPSVRHAAQEPTC